MKTKILQEFIPTRAEVILSYISVFFFAQYCMFDVGQETRKLVYDTDTPLHGVKPGLFGYMKDTSDFQWSQYSNNFHITLIAFITFVLIKQIILRIFHKSEDRFSKLVPALMNFYTIFGAILVSVMFHAGTFYWVTISFLYYQFTDKFYKKNWFPFVIWAMFIFNLFLMEVTNGLDIGNLVILGGFGKQFDEWKNEHGLIKWNVIFNMTMLRIVSFAMDRRWAYLETANPHQSQDESSQQSNIPNTDTHIDDLKNRYKTSLPLDHYNIKHYFAYLLYSPIFLSGPPLTFNAWLSQIHKPLPTVDLQTQLKYTFRTIILLVTFEIWLHINQAYALCTLSQNRKHWNSMDTLPLMVAGFDVLIFIWFKFNSFWKIARCWAFWDDVEVPENLNRCICNNYNFEGFWRSWHRGFNQWLIRYLFIPLGGSKSKVWNIWIVFIFVALWHDFKLNLILWAVGICLFLMPEILIKGFFKQKKFARLRQRRIWWVVESLVATLYILLLVFANLIGFGIGYEALILMIRTLLSAGIIASLQVILALIGVVQYMFNLRLKEEQQGRFQGF